MRARGWTVAVGFAMCFSVGLASEPGQPLDCSDWVFLEPGLSCQSVIPFPCPKDSNGQPSSCLASRDTRAVDNEGNILRVRKVLQPSGAICGIAPLDRLELVRQVGGSPEVIGYVEDRCDDPVDSKMDEADPVFDHAAGDSVDLGESSVVAFDAVSGRLLVTVRSMCRTNSANQRCPVEYREPGDVWLLAIEGFTPLFEILQSYDPGTATLGFRAPTHPEGFESGDSFDVWAGDLRDVGDWAALAPLECGLTGDAGDWLTATDTTPTPQPGEGTYFLTSVTRAGETRLGRKAESGVLAGRDPGTLPVCGP